MRNKYFSQLQSTMPTQWLHDAKRVHLIHFIVAIKKPTKKRYIKLIVT